MTVCLEHSKPLLNSDLHAFAQVHDSESDHACKEHEGAKNLGVVSGDLFTEAIELMEAHAQSQQCHP